MAFAAVGSLATANDKTTASSWSSATTTAQLDTGNLCVLVLATDNITTTDGNTNDHTAVSIDTLELTKAREFTNGQGGAAAGCCISIWYVVAPSNIASSSTITVSLSGSLDAKALTAHEFSMAAGNRIVTDAAGDKADDGVDMTAIAISGLESLERLYVRGGSGEWTAGTLTPTTNFTAFTHTSSATAGGLSASNIQSRAEFRINTSTGETSDPVNSSGGGVDWASTMVALREFSPAATASTFSPIPLMR